MDIIMIKQSLHSWAMIYLMIRCCFQDCNNFKSVVFCWLTHIAGSMGSSVRGGGGGRGGLKVTWSLGLVGLVWFPVLWEVKYSTTLQFRTTFNALGTKISALATWFWKSCQGDNHLAKESDAKLSLRKILTWWVIVFFVSAVWHSKIHFKMLCYCRAKLNWSN